MFDKFMKFLCVFFVAVGLIQTIHVMADASLTPLPSGIVLCGSTITPGANIDMSACKGGMLIPVGTTGDRPSIPVAGEVRWNSDIVNTEIYNGSVWGSMSPQVNSDWNASSGLSQILNKPVNVSAFTDDAGYITSTSLSPYLTISTASSTYLTQSAATVALAAKFNSPTGTTAQYFDGTGAFRTFPSITSFCYDGTTKRSNCFPIVAQATVLGGNAVYQLTSDGTSTGTAVCTNGVILNSFQPIALDSTVPYAYGTPVLSNTNRTITLPVNHSSGAVTILTISVLAAFNAANGIVVNMTVLCY